jgi:hypothetical protein
MAKETTTMTTQKATEEELALLEQLKGLQGLGTDLIDDRFVKPPKLVLAQSTTPQVKKSDDKFVEGLAEGNFFNNLTSENFGDGPIRMVVIKMLGAHGVIFDPAEMGKVIESDIKLDDPRMQFTEDDKGDRVKPEATTFLDYLLYLPDHGQVLTFSMKGTQIKVGVILNSIMKLALKVGPNVIANPPSFARVFKMRSVPDTDGNFNWMNIKIVPEGPCNPTLLSQCLQIYNSFDKKQIQVDRSDAVPTGKDREPGEDDGDLAADMK